MRSAQAESVLIGRLTPELEFVSQPRRLHLLVIWNCTWFTPGSAFEHIAEPIEDSW